MGDGMCQADRDAWIARVLIEVGRRGFVGSASELLEQVESTSPDWGYFPRAPRAISVAVRRFQDELESAGVGVCFWRTANKRLIELRPR